MANVEKQRSTTSGFIAQAQSIAQGIIGRISAKTAGAQSSRTFVANAAIGDMYEIEAAKIALDQARSTRVREIAETMIDAHTTTTHHLRSALRMNEARNEGVPPDSIDRRRKRMLDQLRAARDGDFDRLYLDQQVLAHKETVDLMTGYAARGQNPQLRSVAAGTAPVVKRHLRHVEALRDQLTG